ncbi:MAG TPA: hypothetical protein DD435_06680 [Cyanobacteria bacterium UBA8530]|nr:hypothetical protein [Cyanobacteria bacterium UBA8530]
MRRLTCLVCPSGCQLILENGVVKGHRCPRGEKYAIEEALTPLRFLTTTLPVQGGKVLRLPVKTKERVPLQRIKTMLCQLSTLKVRPPVRLGEVVARLPEEVIATRTLLALLFFFGLGAPAYGWARHDLLVRQVFGETVWLDRYKDIVVTAYDYEEKAPYNPDYEAKYPDKKVGERTTAREILIHYADEPDWGMDANLNLSSFQPIIGGSRGYRHQYYFFGLLRLGQGPERAAYFYDMSKQAFAKGDSYWGFRFFARCLHYLQDLGQPLHTQPATMGQIGKLMFQPPKLVNFATNLHYAYERYVAAHLGKRDESGEMFAHSLRDPGMAELFDMKEAAQALAEYSHEKAERLLIANENFWPKRVKSKSKLMTANPEEIFPKKRSLEQGQIDAITVNSLKTLGQMSRGALELLRKEALEPPPAKPTEEE